MKNLIPNIRNSLMLKKSYSFKMLVQKIFITSIFFLTFSNSYSQPDAICTFPGNSSPSQKNDGYIISSFSGGDIDGYWIDFSLSSTTYLSNFLGVVNSAVQNVNSKHYDPTDLPDYYPVNMGYKIEWTTAPPMCQEYHIYYTIYGNNHSTVLYTKDIQIVRNDYIDNAHIDLLYVPDLFMKDNSDDIGEEPNYRWKPNSTWKYFFDESPDLINRLRTGDPFAFTGRGNEPPQRSTKSNHNNLYYQVWNRSCADVTGSVNIELYWTINRTFEDWGHDWVNYSNHSYALNNKVTDFSIDHPLGNEIHLSDIDNYNSSLTTISLTTPIYAGSNYTNYFQWAAPDPAWYGPINPNIHYYFGNTSAPVICLLAILREQWKTDYTDGLPYNPDIIYATPISELVYKDNNVVTVNTYLATPNSSYKNGPDGNGNYSSDVGIILVTNPHDTSRTVNLRIANLSTTGTPSFSNYGNIYFALDIDLWNLWKDGGSASTGISSIEGQDGLFVITDFDNATLQNISLHAGAFDNIGLSFEYSGSSIPGSKIDYHYVVGEYDITSDDQTFLGSPGHYLTTVLDTPQVCTDTSIIDYKRQTDIKNLNSTSKALLSIYPNPVLLGKDILTVNYFLPNETEVNIELSDNIGRVIEQRGCNANANTIWEEKFNVEGLSNGIYFIRLKTSSENLMQRFVINK